MKLGVHVHTVRWKRALAGGGGALSYRRGSLHLAGAAGAESGAIRAIQPECRLGGWTARCAGFEHCSFDDQVLAFDGLQWEATSLATGVSGVTAGAPLSSSAGRRRISLSRGVLPLANGGTALLHRTL